MSDLNDRRADRVVLVDALRGFALMGLLLVHAIELFELYWKNPVESRIHDLIFFLFAGKAYAIFALLFGVSFFLIMDHQARKGVDFRGRFLWRLLILFVLGTLNSLIYSGEVLQLLALCGLILVLIHGVASRWLWILALLALLNLPLLHFHLAAAANLPGANELPLGWRLYPECLAIWSGSDSAWEVMRFNLITGSAAKWLFFFEGSRGLQVFGLLLLGLLLGRAGFFRHPEHFVRARRLALSIAVPAAIALYAARVHVSALPESTWPDQAMARWYLEEWLGGFFALAFALILVLGFVAAWQRDSLRSRLNLLAPVGQMSLTTYVVQGLVGVPFFYHYGLDMWDELSQAECLALGALFFLGQLGFAHWWLKRYRHGPLEWLWRAATYASLKLPFRRERLTAAGENAA